MIYVFTWIVLALLVGALGSNRKIGFAVAFFLSIVLSPLIGFIITIVSKDKQTDQYERMMISKMNEGNTATLEEMENLEKAYKGGLIKRDEYEAIKLKRTKTVEQQ